MWNKLLKGSPDLTRQMDDTCKIEVFNKFKQSARNILASPHSCWCWWPFNLLGCSVVQTWISLPQTIVLLTYAIIAPLILPNFSFSIIFLDKKNKIMAIHISRTFWLNLFYKFLMFRICNITNSFFTLFVCSFAIVNKYKHVN